MMVISESHLTLEYGVCTYSLLFALGVRCFRAGALRRDEPARLLVSDPRDTVRFRGESLSFSESRLPAKTSEMSAMFW
jgi:hypothetical protein